MSRFAAAALSVFLLAAGSRADFVERSDPKIVGWATGAIVTRGSGSVASGTNTEANATGMANGTTLSLGNNGQATLTFAAPIANGAGADFVVFENGFLLGSGPEVFAELAYVAVSSNGVDFFRFPSISLTQTATQLRDDSAPSGIDPANITNLAGAYPNSSFGTLFQGTAFDLSDLAADPLLDVNHITHVRLTDIVGSLTTDPVFDSASPTPHIINDPLATSTTSAGFDLDAVGVINVAPVPEPSSIALLLALGGAAGVVRWRKRRGAPTAVALLLGLMLAGGVRADTAEKEFPKLHGTWIVVSAEKDGQAFDRITGGKLVVKDQNFAIVTKNGTEMKGDLVLAPGKKPKHIDFTHQEGLLRDKTWQGVYELDGDELKLCYAEADTNKDRPTEFKTAQDSGLLLIVMKRKKD